MKRTRMNNSQENELQPDSDAIDRILAAEEQLVPSSGFLTSVMGRVHEEANAPDHMPFPWKRAIPGIVLAACVFGWGAVEFFRPAVSAVRAISWAQPQISISIVRPLEQAGWVALGLVISLVSWLLSRRIAGQSGLL